VINRRRSPSRPRVTRLRILRRGWGRFTEEIVTIADLDPDEAAGTSVGSVIDVDDILDLDDEDAETGLAYRRDRLN